MKNTSISNFPKEILQDINWWFNAAVYHDGQRYINRIKLVQSIGFVLFFIIAIINYLLLLPYSYMIAAATTLGMMGARFWINKGKLQLAKTYMAILVCTAVFLLNYAVGTSSGVYLYYFLFLNVVIFTYEGERIKKINDVYLLIMFSLTACVLFSPGQSTIQKISPELSNAMFYYNFVLTFLMGLMLSYIMIKDSSARETALMSKQKFLDSIYNTSLDAVFIIDSSSGAITDSNFQSLKLFEAHDKTNLIGRPITDFFKETDPEEGASAVNFETVISNFSTNWQGNIICCTAAQNYFAGYASVVPFMYEGKQLKKLNVIDISEIKKAELALKDAKEKAERLAMVKSKFLSNMSHELRTPLNGIIGTTNILLQETHMPHQRQQYGVLKYSSEQMLNLINDILDFSKIEAGKMELEKTSFDLSATISNITNLFHYQFEQKGVLFEYDIDKKINKEFLSDEVRLSQVLTNLLSNSLKFTPAGGKVSLSITQHAANSEKTTLQFSVKDNGVGIPYEKQQTIFESFTQVDTATTRKFGGTGLGLTISKHIIELFGSKLNVISAPGKGSCFYFFVELENNNISTSFVNEKVVSGLHSLKGMKVLVAEDNPINMMVARKFLERWDVNITEAVNGAKALEQFNKDKFDVLLIDLEMPEMDGYQFVSAIKEINKNVPAIAFTAAVFDNMQAHLINSGFTDYIQKPFRPEDLHKKLSRFYEMKRAS
jgi:signal transduction histidine kinase/CheY-like chemotaxis protein